MDCKVCMGCVALVGAGPGDRELLTLKGRRALEDADAVVYDRLVGFDIRGFAGSDAELIDVGKIGGCHPTTQREIEQILIEKAREGKKVVRLKGGDPFLFGRGGEEASALAEAGVPFEVIPGVTSAIAVPAYAGIPVTHRDYASSLHIITAHKREDCQIDYEAIARLGGTLVFLMGASRIAEICARLTEAGMSPDAPAAVIENGTTARQRQIIGTLGSIAELSEASDIRAPAVIVVGQVVKFASETNGKLTRLSLAGKRIIIPVVARKRGRGRLAALLRARGAEVAEITVSRVEAIEAPLPPLSGYSRLVFTSAAGVEKFFELLKFYGRDIREIGSAKIAAIGPATKDAVETFGLRADLVPPVYNGTALGEALAEAASDERGGRLLLLRAENGAPELVQPLRDKGINFDEVAVYRTVAVEVDTDELEPADAAAFTCASSVRNFRRACLGRACPGSRIKAACIGERTAAAAREAGYEVYTARNSTLEDLADAIEEVVKTC